jgi:diguanylate cyclase (GGDEF)-like protein/PAS domain S-box-containing protein
MLDPSPSPGPSTPVREARFGHDGVLASISMELMDVGAGSMEDGFRRVLGRLGPLLGAQRVSLWLARQGRTLEFACGWSAGPDLALKGPPSFPRGAFPWFETLMTTSRAIAFARLEDLPPEASGIRGVLESFDVTSVLWSPLRRGDEPLGLLAAAMLGGDHAWPPEHVSLVESVGGLLAAFLSRAHSDAGQAALLRIANRAMASKDLADCLAAIHGEVASLMDARNFYVALWDEKRARVSFPYFVDEVDPAPAERGAGRSLTDYVIRTGRPLLATPDVFEALVEGGEVDLIGAPSLDWLGVPLVSAGRTTGALVVQTYARGVRYGARERDLLAFVSRHVGGILERIQAGEALSRSEEHYRRLFERSLAGVARKVPGGPVLDCNDAFARICGYGARGDVVGKTLADLMSPSTDAVAIGRALAAEGPVSDLEVAILRPDGTEGWILMNAVFVPEEGPSGGVYELTVVDITARKLAERRIEHQAFHDLLTGLANRRLFRDRLDVALAQSRRSGRELALLALDLDRFRLLNDSLGYAAGDRILQEVGTRLTRCVHEGDTVARLSGDEFTLLLTDVTGDGVSAVARLVMDAVARPLDVDGREIFVTASVGVALSSHDGTDAERLLKNADNALRRAREAGGDTVELSTPALTAAARELSSVHSGLRRALEAREFVLFYQPVVSLGDGRVTAVEALLRWARDPGREPLLPASFLAVAEESRLIVPIGRWALERACRDARRWRDLGHSELRVAVNVSARQIQRGTLVSTVQEILRETGMPPASLVLEITETTAMENMDLAIATLSSLREMGVRLAIDDFGTGHSSLAYLKRFPVTTLKIDKTFVRNLHLDLANRAILAAIVETARRLEVETVAEGVETEAELAALRALGCDKAQGFLLGKPVPFAGIARFLPPG